MRMLVLALSGGVLLAGGSGRSVKPPEAEHEIAASVAGEKRRVELGSGTGPIRANPDLVRRFQATITPAELRAHVAVLASDELEGRRTATRGQRLAAGYLASSYARMGLEAAGRNGFGTSNGAYLQPFDVIATRVSRVDLTVEQNGLVLRSAVYGPDRSDGTMY